MGVGVRGNGDEANRNGVNPPDGAPFERLDGYRACCTTGGLRCGECARSGSVKSAGTADVRRPTPERRSEKGVCDMERMPPAVGVRGQSEMEIVEQARESRSLSQGVGVGERNLVLLVGVGLGEREAVVEGMGMGRGRPPRRVRKR